MRKFKISSIAVIALCALTLTACGGGATDGDTTTPSSGVGGGGTGGGGTTLTCGNGGGFAVTTRGVYVDSLAAGATFSAVTLNLSSTQTGSLANVTVEAHSCGFGGTLLQTITANTAQNMGTNGAATTFTFPGAVTVPSCGGGVNVVALKIIGNSGGTLSIWGQSSGAGSCGGKISSDLTTTPPAQQAGVWYANIVTQ